jgi:hypothetical protein
MRSKITIRRMKNTMTRRIITMKIIMMRNMIMKKQKMTKEQGLKQKLIRNNKIKCPRRSVPSLLKELASMVINAIFNILRSSRK